VPCEQRLVDVVVVGCCSLVDEGVCSEQNVPSISSINRIIRHESVTSRRTTLRATQDDVRASYVHACQIISNQIFYLPKLVNLTGLA